MAYETVRIAVTPQDGWVQVSNDPAYLLVKPDSGRQWRIAATASGAPSDGARASGTITYGAQPNAADTITAGTQTYTYVGALTGADDILIGASVEETIDNTVAAINGAAGEGVIYGTGTTANADAIAGKNSATVLGVRAKLDGAAGNSIALAESTGGVRMTVSGATLAGGAGEVFGIIKNAYRDGGDHSYEVQSPASPVEHYVRVEAPSAPGSVEPMLFNVIRDQ